MLKAGATVILKVGFHAKAGSDFTAKIGVGCEPIPLHNPDSWENLRMNADGDAISIGENINFKIAPNPFQSSTKLFVKLVEREAVNIQIFDQTGRLVQTILNNQVLDKGQHQIDLQGQLMNTGVYFVNLRTVSQQIMKKVIVVE